MFYSQVILARKGPLGKIWLAAHFDKKLTKNQIFATDISDSVDSVLNPSAPLALRVSGHLMLGIVRIYSRKVKYLMTDCTEAMWKIKLAFRPGNVDIDLNAANNLNIDDMRFFGNLSVNNDDFPEFSDAAFPEMLLNNYDNNNNNNLRSNKRTGSHSDSYFLSANNSNRASLDHWDTEIDIPNFEDSFHTRKDVSPIENNYNPRASLSRSGDKSQSSRVSRVSDVELVRGEGSSRDLMNMRTSLSLGGNNNNNNSERFSTSLNKFEDDVPAFLDNEQDQHDNDNLLGEFNAPDLYQPEYQYEDDLMVLGEEEEEVQQQHQQEEQQQQGQRQEVDDDDDDKEKTKKKKRPAKRQRATIDTKVELSDEEFKRRLSDSGPTLRRQLTDKVKMRMYPSHDSSSDLFLSNCPIAERAMLPVNLRDLCPELLDLFRSTLNKTPLPTSSKDKDRPDGVEVTRAAAEEEEEVQQQQDQDQYLYEQPEEHVEIFETDFVDNNYNPSLPLEETRRYEERPSLSLSLEKTDMSTRISDVLVSSSTSSGPTKIQTTMGTRSSKVLEVMREELLRQESNEVSFSNLSEGVSKRVAASLFLEILQLQTWGMVQTRQDRPFQEIQISLNQ